VNTVIVFTVMKTFYNYCRLADCLSTV